ncbi:L-histidine N(alpha)-methyltransferase [Hankyongella ginsenosidimutans]|uniref:L-histidine N(alpha)-methyltransferase n=1 Tax=Hankyongella ginsenosidimutans TaxID=1763828 RepID=UPI003CCC5CAF
MSLPTTLRKASPGNPMLADALEGLSRPRKTLPSKYFYDAHGSALFVRITELPEYYPTRTELAILTQAAPRLALLAKDVGTVVEYGSGDGRKSQALLQALPCCKAYVPVEISGDALVGQVARLRAALPALTVMPLEADFTHPFKLPAGLPSGPRMGFFPGSTIGNLVPADAVDLLRGAQETLGDDALFVLGVDLKKPLERLIPAYDDPAGVTAAFNLNLLARLNRELGRTSCSIASSTACATTRGAGGSRCIWRACATRRWRSAVSASRSAAARRSTPRTATSSHWRKQACWRAPAAGSLLRPSATPRTCSLSCCWRPHAGTSRKTGQVEV